MHRSVFRALALSALIVPSAALAHTGHGDSSGVVHGFMHPIGGIDHILAMVTVGLLAGQLGGRALWLVPASFVGAMVAGGLLGISGVTLPLVETAIAFSVVALGAAVALGLHMPAAAAMGLAAVFAVFHGYAHGAEMPVETNALGYAAGFVAATALLHLAGIGLGTAIARLDVRLVRTAGAAVVVAGAFLLAGAL